MHLYIDNVHIMLGFDSQAKEYADLFYDNLKSI